MDEASKAKLRKSAKRRFQWTVVLLRLGSLIGVDAFLRSRIIIERSYQQITLAQDSRFLWQERVAFAMERVRRLGYFPPPASAADRARWASEVADFFGYRVPLCVIDGMRAQWVVPPDAGMQALTDSALMTPANPLRPVKPLSQFGSVAIRFAEAPRPFEDRSFAVISDLSRHLAWGALIDYSEEWLAFYRHLSLPRDSAVEFGSPAQMLANVYALPRSGPNGTLPRLRARYHGTEIFASPGLDTTAAVYHVAPVGELKEDIFSPPHVPAYYLIWVLRAALAGYPILLLLFVLPFYRWYRRVMQLTEPEPPAVSHPESDKR